MKRKYKFLRKLVQLLFLIIAIFAIDYFFLSTDEVDGDVVGTNEDIVDENKSLVTLVKCIDGDTAKIICDGEEINVRFLAVNTKEKNEEYGEEAFLYTCDRLTSAEKIELEFDSNSDKYDKYNRLLAWIFVDGELLQYDMVSLGYAEVKYIYGDYKYLEKLNEFQEKAKLEKIGIWGL